MNFDLRLPIGLMFSIIGALLTVKGLIDRSGSISLDININFVWGLVLFVFGTLMFLLASRGKTGSK
jgi:hypothetical protein